MFPTECDKDFMEEHMELPADIGCPEYNIYILEGTSYARIYILVTDTEALFISFFDSWI